MNAINHTDRSYLLFAFLMAVCIAGIYGGLTGMPQTDQAALFAVLIVGLVWLYKIESEGQDQ